MTEREQKATNITIHHHDVSTADLEQLHGHKGVTIWFTGLPASGKSTMAKLITRFYDPQQGRVLIDGRPLDDYHQRSLRAQMGIVPQEGFLFSDEYEFLQLYQMIKCLSQRLLLC